MPAKEELGSSSKKKLIQINSASVQGESGTGYEGPNDLGEFECENCKYFDEKDSSCGQKDMKKYSKQPRLKNGRVKVDPEGCCEYVERVGRKDEDEDEE
jgi:hypothetical protein